MKKGKICGFCRKRQKSVGLIIAENLGEICCECLSICLDMIFVNGTKIESFSIIEKTEEVIERVGYKVKIKRYEDNDCFFCLKKVNQVNLMIKGYNQLICDQCAVTYSRLALDTFGRITRDIIREDVPDSSSSKPS